MARPKAVYVLLTLVRLRQVVLEIILLLGPRAPELAVVPRIRTICSHQILERRLDEYRLSPIRRARG